MTFTRLVALVFMSAAVLTAGAQTTTAQTVAIHPAAHGSLNACKLMTLSDVKTAYKGSDRMTRSGVQGAFNTCDYETSSGLVTLLVTDTALIKAREPGATDAPTLYSQTLTGIPFSTKTIHGLGDKAFFSPSYGQLWVLKGDVVFNVSHLGKGLAPLRQLAQKILHRL